MKRWLIFAVVVASLLLVPQSALAHHDEGTVHEAQTNEEIEARKEELRERKEQLEAKRNKAEERLKENQARKCEFVKTRLEFHRDKAAEIREHRQKRYQHIIDRLNALADRLDNNELDSIALRAKIVELSALVSTYADTYTDYETALQTAINTACEDDDVSKETVKAARELLAKLHSNAESVHTFFQEQLKPLLGEIKEEVKNAQAEAEETNNTNTSEER